MSAINNISIIYLLPLLPLALEPTVGFGLSDKVLLYFPICHQLSPSSHSQHLKISFYFLVPSFPGSSPSSRSFQFLSEDLFWASYPPPFSPGDLTSSCLYRGITECYDIQLIDLHVSTTVLFILYKVRLHVSTIHVVILRSLISFKS